jgi:ABC-type transport system involved in multi-copper enzyme maturation permease subunit
MKRYLAILKDTLQETLDYKIFYILMAGSLLIILGILTLKFESKPAQEVIEQIISDVIKGRVENFKETAKRGLSANISFDIVMDNPDTYFERLTDWKRDKLARVKRRGGNTFSVSISQGTSYITKTGTGADTVIEMNTEGKIFRLDKDNIDNELIDCIKSHLARNGVTERTVKLKQGGFPEKRFEVSGKVNYTHLTNSCKVYILPGVLKFEFPTSLAFFTFELQTTLVNFFAGWIGILIALIITAGFIPNMLQKGTIEIWLSKPISRWGLLTYKYIGGLTFVFLNAVVLIGGTFLALSFKTGFWNYWYLVSIFVLVFFFAVLYSVSVFFGILTKSPVVCILMSLLMWFISFIVYTMKTLINSFDLKEQEFYTSLKNVIDVVHFILPKTSEIKTVNNYILTKVAQIPPEMMEQGFQTVTGSDIIKIVLTSLGFMVVVMFLSCWIFSKKDY